MKYIYIFLFVFIFIGCSSPKKPPIGYMSRQSGLPFARYDSVEYYKVTDHVFGTRNPFVCILFFKEKRYRKILHQVKKDTSYYEINYQKQKQEVFKYDFKKYLGVSLQCAKKKMFANNSVNTYTIVIYCNRLYFRHNIVGVQE